MCLWISLCCCRLEIKDVAAFVSSRFALNVSLLPALIFSREKKTGPQKSSRRVYLLSQRERERTAEEIEASHVTRPPIIRSKKHLFFFFIFFWLRHPRYLVNHQCAYRKGFIFFCSKIVQVDGHVTAFTCRTKGREKKKKFFFFLVGNVAAHTPVHWYVCGRPMGT